MESIHFIVTTVTTGLGRNYPSMDSKITGKNCWGKEYSHSLKIVPQKLLTTRGNVYLYKEEIWQICFNQVIKFNSTNNKRSKLESLNVIQSGHNITYAGSWPEKLSTNLIMTRLTDPDGGTFNHSTSTQENVSEKPR